MDVYTDFFYETVLLADALDHFDGGVRHIVGVNGTGGIWSTYPQEYVSSMTSFCDQVSYHPYDYLLFPNDEIGKRQVGMSAARRSRLKHK